MKKSIQIIFLTFLASLSLYAGQGGVNGSDYMWTDTKTGGAADTVTTFDWIDVKDGNTAIAAPFDNDVSGAINIGFNFSFYGHSFTQVYISSNGWLSFSDYGVNAYQTNRSLPSALAPDSMMAVFWDYLPDDGTNAGVFYKTIGTAPNRKFVVQWYVISFGSGTIEFEAILYEKSNLIKFQYGQINNGYLTAASHTIGLQNNSTDALQYVYNSAANTVSAYSAILWHGEGVSSTDATISPTSVPINTLQQFKYTFDNIQPTTDGLGKIDTIAINVPVAFSASPVVTQIKINSNTAFIQNSNSAPTDRGFATWNYTGNAIQVKTTDFEVIDSLVVSYYLQTPDTPSTGNAFTSTFGAILDTNAMQATTDQNYSVNVNAVVDYYTFNPASDTSFIAGNNLVFEIKAYDENGNAIVNSDSVIVSQVGTADVVFTPSERLGFSNDSTVTVTISKMATGSFSLKAVKKGDATVSGNSGLITATPGAVATITDISGLTSVIAGSDHVLGVQLFDQYGNHVGANVAVDFSIFAGNGSINDPMPRYTDANGIVSVDYTADTLAGGNDIIDVTSTVTDQINLPVIAGPVSYYTLSPPGDSSITAGELLQFKVRAKDQYGNNKDNNGSFTLAGQGSITETFSAGPYDFAGADSVMFTVYDTTAGEFTVVATNTANSNIKGSSGTVTVVHDAASQFAVPGPSPIVAGTNRVLNVTLEDQYGNPVGGGFSVTFTRFSSGNGEFSNASPTINVNTGSYGTASATYTASSQSGTDDSIQVSYNTVLDTIVLPVVNGTLAEIKIQTVAGDGGTVLDDTSLTADDSLTVYAEGYDAQGNYAGAVSATWSGTGIVAGHITGGPDTSATFTAVKTGSGKIKATNGSIDDISGTITVTPGSTLYIKIMDAPAGSGVEIFSRNLNAGDVLNLYANGFDADSNFTNNISVTWGVTAGLDISDLSTTSDSSTIFIPKTAGVSGTITATSAYGTDATGLITVNTGMTLSSLKIRTGPGGSGVELGDSVYYAGDTPTFYAAGYDLYNNFIADQNVNWQIEKVDGDSIGYFTTSVNTDNNTFNATTVNSGRFRINISGVTAYSGTIKIKNGPPANLTAVSSQTVSGGAGGTISDSLAVRLRDNFGNNVPDSVISWHIYTGGSLNPSAKATNSAGIARSRWTLRNNVSVGHDTAYATFGTLDSVEFIATVNPSNANQMSLPVVNSGNGQSDVVGSTLTLPLVVLVRDSLDNPVSGAPVSFSVISAPDTNYVLSPTADTTRANGQVQTTFTLGHKVGTYRISASNAALQGSPVIFTVYATAAGADHLTMYSGDQQSGTVNTTLANDIIVRAEDQYNNAVQNVNISWSGGNIDTLASSLTNAAGLDTVRWTLSTSAGADTIMATGTSLDTVTYTAIATAGAAAKIVEVSGDSTTTIAGGNRKIEARVRDQYDNNVSGRAVSFAPASRITVLNGVSDANGLVSAVYNTPSSQDVSTARAFLAGIDTTYFKIWGIRYTMTTLDPRVVNTGDTTSFLLQVNNPGPNPVQLDTSLSTFSISDGSITDSTKLDSPSVILANSVPNLKFKPLVINNDFLNGSYTPTIRLVGAGPDSSVSGSFITDPNELSIAPLEIVNIYIPTPEDTLTVARGDTIATVIMSVRNRSIYTLADFTVTLTFSPDDGYTQELYIDPGTIPPNEARDFSIRVGIPADAPVGIREINGRISGVIQSTTINVEDDSSSVSAYFRVIAAAHIDWLACSPVKVSENQSASFTATVQNSGQYDVLLNKTNTTLTFGADVFNLASNQAIEGNGALTVLNFTAKNVTNTAGMYPGILTLKGTEQGNNYSTAISTDTIAVNGLTVQTAADLVYSLNTLSTDTVSQGQTGETYQFRVRNNGQATVKISSLSDITVFVGGSDISGSTDYQSSFASGQTFPLYIANGDSESFTFNINVNANALPGNHTFSSQVAFSDSNSSVISNAISTGNPSWDVLAKSAFNITYINAADTEVNRGQSGLSVSVRVVNTGDVAASVDTVYLDFKRNTNSFVPVFIPANIPANDSTTISFMVTIDAEAATGVDSIRAIASGHNNLSGEAISTTSDYLDSWLVSSTGKVSINAVTSTLHRVNRGQQNVPIKVAISNDSPNNVTIDSLKLDNMPAGSTSDTLITSVLGTILANQSRTFNFQSDILGSAPDTIVLGARFYGTDAVSGDPVTDLTAATADTLIVGEPSMLQIDSVYASFYSFTQGQSNLDVRVSIKNQGSSNVSLDSVRLDLSSIDPNPNAGNTLGYSQISPTEANLPTLTPGTSTIVLFRLSSAVSPRDSGLVQIDARVYGKDELSQAIINDTTTTVQADTVLLQTPANPLATQIINVDTVATGQTNINADLVIQNRGTATARIENATINFFNSLLQNVNTGYSKDYPVTPALPFNLAGWQDTTISFTIGVLDSAQPGPIHLGALVQSTELNRNKAITNRDTTLSSWTVIGNGSLSFTVSGSRDSVSTGQQNVPVIVSVTNIGATPVRIDSLQLIFSRGSYDSTSLALTSGNILNPTDNIDFQILVDIQSTSLSGVSTIDAKVVGYDTENKKKISRTGADSGDSWLVQRAVNISITDNTPTVVSTNQIFSHQLTVRNTGEAKLLIDSTNTILYPAIFAGDSVKLTSGTPLVIEGNQTVTLPFTSTSSATAFSDNLVLDLFGTENGAPYNRQINAPNPLTVQSRAAMVIDSTVAVKDSVSQGETPAITVYVSNTGDANLDVDSLISSEYGALSSVTPSLPAVISGHTQTSFSGSAIVDSLTSTGNVILDVRGRGRDSNSGAAADAAAAVSPDNWFVTTAPDIVISSITSADTLVTQGQTGLSIDVTIRNDGETPVNLTSLTLLPTLGLYNPGSVILGRLNGNDSVTVSVPVSVRSNSATGVDSIFARVNYQNLYSLQSSQKKSSVYHQWTIGGTPSLGIVSVQTVPTKVSRGQGPVDVQVRLQNTGDNPVSVQTIGLVFVNGAANYSVGAATPVLPVSIPAKLDRIFTLPVTVDSLAATGFDSISASVTYTSAGSSFPPVADPRINDTWEVQSSPVVLINSVSVNPDTASTGQTGLSGSVYLSNAYALNRATAQIDSVNINMVLSTVNHNDQFTISRVLTPVIPFDLAPGATNKIDFDIDVNNDALTGTYDIDGHVRSQDVNDGTNYINNSAVTPGQLVVQAAASLVVDTVLVMPDVISEGQTHGRILIIVTNTGMANAEITGSSISFSPPYTDFDPVYLDPATPFVLAGGATDTLRYSFVASQNPGNVDVSATVRSKDLNSGKTLPVASSANPTTFLIQTPVSLRWLDTTPPNPNGNSNIQFTVKIENQGDAALQLNNNTYLKLESYNIPLDATSPTLLAGHDSTTLVFRDTLISLPPGKNYALTLYAYGTTNGAAFSNVIGAGSVAYGEGLVSITSILIDGNTTRLQGEEGITVRMNIANQTAQILSIDSSTIDETTLKFFDAITNEERNVTNLHRIDNLTELDSISTPTLRFSFDLPLDFALGQVIIYGRLSLDNHNVEILSDTLGQSATLTVQSAAKIRYVPSTLTPDTIVAGQKVAFRMDFENRGSASVALNRDSSYIQVFSPAVRRYLSGGYTIQGSDTSTITFNELTVPQGQSPGSYNITWHLVGQMLNGLKIPSDSTAYNAFNIVTSSNLVFSNINVVPDQARQGEQNIRINYTVQNNGQSAALLDNINFGFNKGSVPVDNDWIRTTAGLFPDTITAGDSSIYNVDFTVKSDANTGNIGPAPVAYYRDIKVQDKQKISSVVSANDSVEVVVPAIIQIDSLFFARVVNMPTPNAPTVNINQNFTLAVALSNTGAADIASGKVRLKSNSIIIQPLNFTNLKSGQDTVLLFNPLSQSTQGQRIFTVDIDSVFDSGGYPVASAQALDNSETVIVQAPRKLAIASFGVLTPESAKDGTVTVGQNFTVVATILSSGTSAFTPGALRLNLPANYNPVSIDTISSSDLTASWVVTPNDTSTGDFDLISVDYNSIPVDINTGAIVDTGTSHLTIPMHVEPAGSITILTFQKTAPHGNRSFISTGQEFDITATVNINKAFADTTATLNLPAGQGYSVVGSASKDIIDNSVTWKVIAPSTVMIQRTAIFNATIVGIDENTGDLTTANSSNEQLNLVNHAELSLSTNIIGPPGALDKNVSTQQQVVFSTRVTNLGEAGFDNSGKIQFQAQNGALFKNKGSGFVKDGFSTAAFNDTLIIPSSGINVSMFSRLDLDNLPLDLNSEKPVSVKIDSVGHSFQVVKRAELKVSIIKTGVDSNNVLLRATDQEFDISAVVTNNGVAGIDTSDGPHYIVLDTLGAGFTLKQGQNPRQPFTLNNTVKWTIINPPQEGDTIRVRVHADDSTVPFDINDNTLNAFVRNSDKSDSLDISVFKITDTFIEPSFSSTKKLDSLTVGQNQDSIYVEAKVIFDKQLKINKTVSLIFPPNSGYTLQKGNSTVNIDENVLNTTVSWLIKASQTSSINPDILTVYAHSENEDSSLFKNNEAYLKIRTIPKASLSFKSFGIDQPEGARDGEVSEGQEFRLSCVIQTQPHTSASGTGRVQIDFNSEFFSLVEGQQTEQDFKVGDQFFWWIKADSITPDAGTNSLRKDPLNKIILNEAETESNFKGNQARIEKERRKAFNRKVNKIQRLIAQGMDLTVTILKAPDDDTLHVPANIEELNRSQTVRVVPEASITIAGTNAPDTVSTSQVFEFSVQASQKKSNADNLRAEFIIPPSLSTTTTKPDTIPVTVNETSLQAKISVSIPSDYNSNKVDTLGVYLFGEDNNSGKQFITLTQQRAIHIQKRPDLVLKSEILKPQPSNNSVQLSFGQEVQVKVWPELLENTTPNLDYAELAGTGAISLSQTVINNEFTLIPGETISKTFKPNELGAEYPIIWRIRAPQKEITTNLNFILSGLPQDHNSGLNVLSTGNSTASAVSVAPKRIVISFLDSLRTNNSFVQGATDIPILAFDISNIGFKNNLYVTALKVKFSSGNDKTFSPDDVLHLFSRLKVVNYNYIKSKGLAKPAAVPDTISYADITVDQSADNPFDLNFNVVDTLTINPDKEDTLIVVSDFNPSASNISFKTALSDLTVFDVSDSIKLDLIDEKGSPIDLENIENTPIVIVAKDLKESFYTYPNPFGRGDTPEERVAHFNFLLKQPSDVKVQVFSLLGELVWSETKTGLSGNNTVYSNYFKWDGRNNNGKRVLNGGYIGTIEIKPLNGGKVERYITKIVYIK